MPWDDHSLWRIRQRGTSMVSWSNAKARSKEGSQNWALLCLGKRGRLSHDSLGTVMEQSWNSHGTVTQLIPLGHAGSSTQSQGEPLQWYPATWLFSSSRAPKSDRFLHLPWPAVHTASPGELHPRRPCTANGCWCKEHGCTIEINRVHKLALSNMPISWTACISVTVCHSSILSNSSHWEYWEWAMTAMTAINPRVPGQHCSRAVSARNSERLAAKTGAAPQCYKTSIFAFGKCFQFMFSNHMHSMVSNFLKHSGTH